MSIFSVFFGQNIQTECHRGQSLAILRPNASIWPVCTPFWIRHFFQKFFTTDFHAYFIQRQKCFTDFSRIKLEKIPSLRLVLQITGK